MNYAKYETYKTPGEIAGNIGGTLLAAVPATAHVGLRLGLNEAAKRKLMSRYMDIGGYAGMTIGHAYGLKKLIKKETGKDISSADALIGEIKNTNPTKAIINTSVGGLSGVGLGHLLSKSIKNPNRFSKSLIGNLGNLGAFAGLSAALYGGSKKFINKIKSENK